MKNKDNYYNIKCWKWKNPPNIPEIHFLTQSEIQEKYGIPDWIGRKQTMLGLKTQWFYQLGAGEIRYVFFVDDQLIWDWIITEQKMLEVIYPDNELC